MSSRTPTLDRIEAVVLERLPSVMRHQRFRDSVRREIRRTLEREGASSTVSAELEYWPGTEPFPTTFRDAFAEPER